MSTPTTIISPDKIWYKNFDVLFQKDRLTEFIPVNLQTIEEKMNAIVRFGLYISILLALYKRDKQKLLIFPIFLLLTFLIYKNYTKTTENFEKTEQKPVKPTLNNPMMNTLMTDYVDNPNKKQAPKYFMDTKEAESLRNDIKEKLNHDLYLGIDDVYEKNNSQRQFYTTPNTTIPSDQDAYLKFMYPNMSSCKSNTQECKINEDLRGRPFIFPDQENNPKTAPAI
jgi:hypothetical protein